MTPFLKEQLTTIQSKLASSFDLVYRQLVIQDVHALLIFLSSLTDNATLVSLIEGMTLTSAYDITLTFYPGSVDCLSDVSEAILRVLSGQCLVILDQHELYYLIESRRYPSRMTAEPEVERSIRGAHDGFVENILCNVGLLRRRIRDENLSITLQKEGSKTHTDIAYAYIKNQVDYDILHDFIHRLNSITQGEVLSEHQFVELLYGKTWNPYPHVRYTERPDICAFHLLQGYLIVLVDNCPNAIILPTTFFEQTKQIEEYTQTTIIALFTRIIRYIGIVFSIYLLPLWIALLMDQNPTLLQLPMKEVHPFTFGFQIILADIVVEWIRQSLIHTPSILSGIMSFVAVFLLGDLAIELGAYTKEILIMVALCNIGNLLTPSYELSLANKIFRIAIGFLALWFGSVGFFIGVYVHILVLLSTKTMKYPYLYPFIPFSYKEWKRLLFGKIIKVDKK